MSNFPLYISVSTGIVEKDLTATQKADFVKKVNKMDLGGHELVYALIKVYYMENANDSPFTLPYGGKYIDNDMTFDLDHLPTKLRQIIYKFAKIHVKRMKEEAKLAKLQKKSKIS